MTGFIKKNNEEDKIPFSGLDFQILDEISKFITSTENHLVSKIALNKVKKFINIIDRKPFENDYNIQYRILFIERYLHGILDKNITDYSRLIKFCISNGQYSEDIDIYANEIENEMASLTTDDIIFIDSYITDFLKYSFIYKHQLELDELSVLFKSQDYESLKYMSERYERVMTRMTKDFRKVKEIDKDAMNDFDSNNELSLVNAVTYTYNEVNKPNSRFLSSVKKENEMIGGGWEGSRFYLYLGFPGGWKSGKLLNICLDVKKNHKPEEVILKDPTKLPCILYVTQENSIKESIERLWSHYMGDNVSMKDETLQSAMQKIKDAGLDEGINLRIKYRKSKSISTIDVDAMIDEAEIDGYEVIMLVHDYVKRIRSSENFADQYMELGTVADDFC